MTWDFSSYPMTWESDMKVEGPMAQAPLVRNLLGSHWDGAALVALQAKSDKETRRDVPSGGCWWLRRAAINGKSFDNRTVNRLSRSNLVGWVMSVHTVSVYFALDLLHEWVPKGDVSMKAYPIDPGGWNAGLRKESKRQFEYANSLATTNTHNGVSPQCLELTTFQRTFG